MLHCRGITYICFMGFLLYRYVNLFKEGYQMKQQNIRRQNNNEVEPNNDKQTSMEVPMELESNDDEDIKQNNEEGKVDYQCIKWNEPANNHREQELRNQINTMADEISVLKIKYRQVLKRNAILSNTCRFTNEQYEAANASNNNIIKTMQHSINELQKRLSKHESYSNASPFPLSNLQDRYVTMENFILCCYAKQKFRFDTEQEIEARS